MNLRSFDTAVLAGIATAHAALDVPDGAPVNFHWVLLGLIGVESIALLVWLVFAIAAPARSRSPSLGGLVAMIGRWLASQIHRGEISSAVAASVASVHARGAIARWSFGSMTHGLWLTFLVGALAMSLLSLSVKQIHFTWQTTILSQQTYLPATEALAALPRIVGFSTPTAAEIRASRWTEQATLSQRVSRKWAELLLACLILYAIVPRALLLAFCWLRRSRALRRWRLDLDLPEYQRLAERLLPPKRGNRIIDDDEDDAVALPAEFEADPNIQFDGPVALIALEMEIPGGGWPPVLAGIDWRDLGSVETRDDRRGVLEAFPALEAGLVLVAVSLVVSPDRGVDGFVRRLREATGAPMVALLTDRERLRRRFRDRDAAQRIADWRRLCANAGIPTNWAIEFEAADPGPRDKARLARLLCVETP